MYLREVALSIILPKSSQNDNIMFSRSRGLPDGRPSICNPPFHKHPKPHSSTLVNYFAHSSPQHSPTHPSPPPAPLTKPSPSSTHSSQPPNSTHSAPTTSEPSPPPPVPPNNPPTPPQHRTSYTQPYTRCPSTTAAHPRVRSSSRPPAPGYRRSSSPP